MTANPQNQFYISDSAAKRLETLLNSQENGSFMRVSVLGGGCSGFEYRFKFDQKSQEDDIIFSPAITQNVKVAIDSISMPFLAGATLDFIDTFGSAKFKIVNPQADSSCGCGNSFSVKL